MLRTLKKEVARTGIEPATQGFSVLKSHFPAILWMTLNQPTLLDSIGKIRFFLVNSGRLS